MDDTETYHMFNLKDTLTEMIENNQNDVLYTTLNENPHSVALISRNMAYMSLYKAACMRGNYIAIDILKGHGLDPRNYDFNVMSDYELWYGNPVAFALESTDTIMLIKLLEVGFVSSCPECMNAGTPETCVILSSLKSQDVSDDQFTRILRASDRGHVISSFCTYIEEFENDEFVEEHARRFLKSMCKSVPQFHNAGVYVTSKNHDFIMDMIHDKILDINHMLECVLDTMMGYAYNFFYVDYQDNMISIPELEEFIIGLIDMGASLTRNLSISSTIVVTDLNIRYIPGSVGPDSIADFECNGTIGDIVGSALSNKPDTIRSIVDTQMCGGKHVSELFHAISNIYSHVRFCKRQGLIHRRVHGYGGSDSMMKSMFDLESSIFSHIATYIY